MPELNSPLAALREQVERMLDSEKLLPADGEALLGMLRKAEERLVTGDVGEASGLLLGFESLLRALQDSGVLDRKSTDLCLVMVRETAESING